MSDDEVAPPTCPHCGKRMHLDRVAARILGQSELTTYACPTCWGEVVVFSATKEDH